jgi:hypothetical protein
VRLFAKLLLLTAPVYGLLMASVAGGGDSPSDFLALVALAGLPFGISFSALMTLLHRRMGGGERTKAQDTVELPIDLDDAFQLCRAASVETLGKAKVRTSDERERRLELTTRPTFTSWGERIELQVDGVDGTATVTVSSRPSFTATLVDYGRNRRNVEQLTGRLLLR